MSIKTGDINTPFRISIYDKRDGFTFWIVNFPHMDSNIPANSAYSVYIIRVFKLKKSSRRKFKSSWSTILLR